jgi:hypothetical protein
LVKVEVTDLADELKVIRQDKVLKVVPKKSDKFITPTVRVRILGSFKPISSNQIFNCYHSRDKRVSVPS